MKRILFVCLGNICRSPTADGIMQQLIMTRQLESHFECDSAGTSAHHIGEAPDPRSRQLADSRNVSIEHIRSRQIVADDLNRFDLVLAMDNKNLRHLQQMAKAQQQHKIRLLLDYHPNPSLKGKDVPDPYYGAGDGFTTVFELCEQACLGLIEDEFD